MSDDPLLAEVAEELGVAGDPELDYQLNRARHHSTLIPSATHCADPLCTTCPPNRVQQNVETKMRQFTSGATRHTDEGKLDPEGFLSPLVILGFCEYMHRNRVQADGQLRASDNWQKGIPRDAYMKSEWRHFLTQWDLHRNPRELTEIDRQTLLDAIYGVMFNAMGYAHELLKEQ